MKELTKFLNNDVPLQPFSNEEFFRLLQELVKEFKEVKIVEEQEESRREAIKAVKEITLEKLRILEKMADTIAKEKLKLLVELVNTITKAIEQNNFEACKIYLSAFVHMSSSILGEDIERLGRVLRGKDETIEI